MTVRSQPADWLLRAGQRRADSNDTNRRLLALKIWGFRSRERVLGRKVDHAPHCQQLRAVVPPEIDVIACPRQGSEIPLSPVLSSIAADRRSLGQDSHPGSRHSRSRSYSHANRSAATQSGLRSSITTPRWSLRAQATRPNRQSSSVRISMSFPPVGRRRPKILAPVVDKSSTWMEMEPPMYVAEPTTATSCLP
jgi:hypothetical protein